MSYEEFREKLIASLCVANDLKREAFDIELKTGHSLCAERLRATWEQIEAARAGLIKNFNK